MCQEEGNITFPSLLDLAQFAVCVISSGNTELTHLQHGAHHDPQDLSRIWYSTGCFQACTDAWGCSALVQSFVLCCTLWGVRWLTSCISQSLGVSNAIFGYQKLDYFFTEKVGTICVFSYEDDPPWSSESKQTILLN